MSPEQAAGASEIDGRSDLYSLGCVLFEMLTGEPPFTGDTPQSVIAKRFIGPPPSLANLRGQVPPAVEAAVARTLSREPRDRFATAGELAAALATPSGRTPALRPPRSRRPIAAAGMLGILLLLSAGIAVGGWYPGHSRRAASVRWATDTAIPLLRTLVDSGVRDSAYIVARKAQAILPADSAVDSLMSRLTDTLTIRTDPPGARVRWARYRAPAADSGVLLGTTPLPAARLPRRISRLRLEKPGYRPLELAVWTAFGTRGTFTLQGDGDTAMAMVRVTGGNTELNLPGLEQLDSLALGDYLLGRYEVTNRQYKAFVDAGGYSRREWWREPFTTGGRPLGWSDAMARFVDKTGRPGPATWEGGSYPSGQAEYPVTGVSWYEAAAYAAYAGAELPTIYHWSRAAFTWAGAAIVPESNFGRGGLAPVGRYRGVGPFGNADMAGNAREWCFNQTGSERYILGGGYNDPTYAFNDAYAQDPMDRSATNGFRVVRYLSDEHLATARRPIVRAFRDFAKERPVSDQVFAVYRRMYDYDRTRLNAVMDTAREETDDWVREKVYFDAAYNRERVAAYLYLPKHGKPPYQTVVFFPGSDAIHERNSSKDIDLGAWVFDFIIRSGRAVVHPVYKSTYERQDSLQSDYADESNFYKEHVIAWAKDMRRTIDYLATRPDIDATRLAYYGVSWGGYLGGLMPAVEPRFKAVVLVVAGLEYQRGQPEVEPINFLPRITIPTLMLNGRYDFYFPVETSQVPMFRLLGTPANQKRYVLENGSHFVPRARLIQETLAWLDKWQPLAK